MGQNVGLLRVKFDSKLTAKWPELCSSHTRAKTWTKLLSISSSPSPERSFAKRRAEPTS